MSRQDNRKLASILKSIEVVEDKANKIYSEYTLSNSDVDPIQSTPIDDTNTHLQIFFQHLEHLLQIDLRNRKSLLNNKRNYWNFFSLALKESKGLYDTVLYVLNSQDVKTFVGRGRLFLRFCLQNHRLGDVIQQSFMVTKLVSQFYNDECFWAQPIYMNRIIQALYKLNDVQFDLLSTVHYQLDVCWPTTESIDLRRKHMADPLLRCRTNSVSSFLSMDSLPSQMIVSSSPFTSSLLQNLESSIHDDSSAYSMSSVDEFAENDLNYWKERCQQLESQLQSTHNQVSSNDVETQCSVDKIDEILQTVDTGKFIEENVFKTETDKLKSQNETLKDEIQNLNFQLSTITMQRSLTENKYKTYEHDMAQRQALIDAKDQTLSELQQKLDEQSNSIKLMEQQHAKLSQEKDQQIESVRHELDELTKLLQNEQASFERQRLEHEKIQDQLEASLHEKTLDFEEMKRRLIKAVCEKAEMFNSLYSYEVKLEEEHSRQWVHEEDVVKCTKCQTQFGWTLRKYRCRHCHQIFCYYCSKHFHDSAMPNSQHRLCDLCHGRLVKESLMSNYTLLEDSDTDPEERNDSNLHFEVRSERLSTPVNDPSSPSEQ